jgi:hypothetical protein
MEPGFDYIISQKSDDELQERIDNRQNYLPETVEMSLAELQRRGHEFTDEELKVIHDDVKAHRANAAAVDGRLGFFNNNNNNVIISDPDAPSLYSRRALYTFTVLCGALFGSVLLAINIGQTQKKIGAVWVILFGLAFTALQIYFVNTFAKQGSGGSGAIIGGIISAYILDYFFWKKFIGYSTFYRAKPIWIPLIIAIVIVALLVVAFLSDTPQ